MDTRFQNSNLLIQDGLVINSGGNTTLAGAQVKADTIDLDVGGNLEVESLVDHFGSSNFSQNLSGSVAFGAGGGFSVNAGFQVGYSDINNVGSQTSLVGHSRVSIKVTGNTDVKGAVIAADNNNLTLDTGSLTYEDIKTHSESQQFGTQIGFDYDNNANNADGSANQHQGGHFDTIGVNYDSLNRDVVNHATIGEGTIIVGGNSDPNLGGLNRDTSKAVEVTRDEAHHLDAYFIVPGGKTADELRDLGNFILHPIDTLNGAFKNTQDLLNAYLGTNFGAKPPAEEPPPVAETPAEPTPPAEEPPIEEPPPVEETADKPADPEPTVETPVEPEPPAEDKKKDDQKHIYDVNKAADEAKKTFADNDVGNILEKYLVGDKKVSDLSSGELFNLLADLGHYFNNGYYNKGSQP